MRLHIQARATRSQRATQETNSRNRILAVHWQGVRLLLRYVDHVVPLKRRRFLRGG
jgi:hypothetical protein